MLGILGFDYIWIDTEHTPLTLDGVEKHMIAARAAGISPIVRVPENHPVRLKPVLEMGPDAVVIPQVNSYEEVVEAVRNCAYPPLVVRGWGPDTPPDTAQWPQRNTFAVHAKRPCALSK